MGWELHLRWELGTYSASWCHRHTSHLASSSVTWLFRVKLALLHHLASPGTARGACCCSCSGQALWDCTLWVRVARNSTSPLLLPDNLLLRQWHSWIVFLYAGNLQMHFFISGPVFFCLNSNLSLSFWLFFLSVQLLYFIQCFSSS